MRVCVRVFSSGHCIITLTNSKRIYWYNRIQLGCGAIDIEIKSIRQKCNICSHVISTFISCSPYCFFSFVFSLILNLSLSLSFPLFLHIYPSLSFSLPICHHMSYKKNLRGKDTTILEWMRCSLMARQIRLHRWKWRKCKKKWNSTTRLRNQDKASPHAHIHTTTIISNFKVSITRIYPMYISINWIYNFEKQIGTR